MQKGKMKIMKMEKNKKMERKREKVMDLIINMLMMKPIQPMLF
jgi:hypothetical protein